jgi:hypothetical protein
MDQAHQNNASSCPVCGGSRWWYSRTGASVCQHCYPDAMAALHALADQLRDESRVPGPASLADLWDHASTGPAA